MKNIKIQYLNDNIKRLEYIDGKSDWIDLRAAEDIVLKKGAAMNPQPPKKDVPPAK